MALTVGDRGRFADAESRVDRALGWLERNQAPGGGLRSNPQDPRGYAEVTGYTVPTLLAFSRTEYALTLSAWLISEQKPDGSFADLDQGTSYVFDTAQALRGLLAVRQILPQARDAAARAAEFIAGRVLDRGKKGFARAYGGAVPESIHLYALPPLFEAADMTANREWLDSAENCVDFYLGRHYCLNADSTLTHFLGYEIEALIDLGRRDVAVAALGRVKERQRRNGAVTATASCSWVCTPGVAQLAVCWAKVGDYDAADAALNWLRCHQRASGGFWGSYGYRAQYAPLAELSWAVKFYLDSEQLLRGRLG